MRWWQLLLFAQFAHAPSSGPGTGGTSVVLHSTEADASSPFSERSLSLQDRPPSRQRNLPVHLNSDASLDIPEYKQPGSPDGTRRWAYYSSTSAGKEHGFVSLLHKKADRHKSDVDPGHWRFHTDIPLDSDFVVTTWHEASADIPVLWLAVDKRLVGGYKEQRKVCLDGASSLYRWHFGLCDKREDAINRSHHLTGFKAERETHMLLQIKN